MKKLLIIILLSITGLQLDAMQQAPDRVPSLLNLAQKELVNESLKGKLSKEDLEKLPEELRVPLQEKIKQGAINQGEPVRSYETKVGKATEFTNGSIRIDNYLGIGDTFYLSKDLQRYLQTDAAGNVRINSLDKKLARTIKSMYYPEEEEYDYDYGASGPSLSLYYPLDFIAEFTAGRKSINLDSELLTFTKIPALTLLSLHNAINNLNKNGVEQILSDPHLLQYSNSNASKTKTRNQLLSANGFDLNGTPLTTLVNYIFVTDNALHRAIKKALNATGKQLDDAKSIIKMLILAGAAINKPNIDGKTALQLAEPNPELRKVMQQAPLLTQTPALQKDLLNAINQQDKAQVGDIIKRVQNRGILDEVLNTSIGIKDTPLVVALKQALDATDKSQVKVYLDIAQLLITNGATLNNPSGKKFLDTHGKQYREKLAPYLKI